MMFSRPLVQVHWVLGHCDLLKAWTLLRPQGTTVRCLASVAAAYNDELKKTAKPLSEIPGESSFLKNMWYNFKYRGKGHLLMKDSFDKFGSIYKADYGVASIVYLSDLKALEHLFRLDAKYPKRITMEPWIHWRHQKKLASGILIENDGIEWKRMRSLLDKHMMRPKQVATYTDAFNEVVTDFVDRLIQVRDTKGNGINVPQLDNELFHWSLETIGTVLYERRFGGLMDSRDPEIGKFIEAVQNIFLTSEKLFFLPMKVSKYLIPSTYKKHNDAWEIIFSTGKKFIDEKIGEIHRKLERGEDVAGFLSFLLASQKLSQDEVYANISELMLGAVDTTSNTMQWVIYELARNQKIQDRLRHELMTVTNGDITDHQALQNMPFLKAVIKEILRLHPIAGVVTRVLQEDTALAGYLVPKDMTVIGNTFVIGRDPDVYEDPDTFKPERWLRNENNDAVHSFAWLPFGFGPRMCIGRRVAELEMHLLTARLVQKFKFIPLDDRPVVESTRGLLVPERTIDVYFKDI